jgi:hypothetical protein
MQMSDRGGFGLLSAPGSSLSAADHPDAIKDGKMGRAAAERLGAARQRPRLSAELPAR